jgi:alcohol dehydrogenase
MRELVFVKPVVVEWREAPEPTLQSAVEAVLRPVVVSTCDLDRALVTGKAPIPGPFPLGHECVADVIEVGDAVRSFRPGDRVVVPFQISCGECARCRRSLTASCSRVPTGAMYGLRPLGGDFGGALSDRLRVPYADAMLVALPSGVAPEAAVHAADNLSDAWRAVAPPLAEQPGAEVLVASGWAGQPLRFAGRVDGDLALLSAKRVDPTPVTTRVVPWQDAAEALIEGATKLVVTRSSED